MTVLITGGTGLIGRALSKALLEKDYQVIILTRDPEKQGEPGSKFRYAHWDTTEQTIDVDAVAEADCIVHLAGEGIADKRWTRKRKKQIVDSRVEGSELIRESLQSVTNHVKTVISASALGWYGEDPASRSGNEGTKREFEESDPPADDFLGTTCKLWEDSIHPVSATGRRLVIFRNGIVLSQEGGALVEFIKPLRFGLAPILGSGKQIVSWIHVDDLVRLYIMAIEQEKFEGVYNAVAPKPVPNKQLMLLLARIKRGRFFISMHIPSFVLKLIFGELSIEVLKSCTVSCSKVHFEGFTFLYPSLEAALGNLTKPTAKA